MDYEKYREEAAIIVAQIWGCAYGTEDSPHSASDEILASYVREVLEKVRPMLGK